MENRHKSSGGSGWFEKSRFGLFIHWGLYSMGARHEWLMHREEIPVDDYRDKYFRHFDPDLYDPGLWAKTAKSAGMKYFVITTKHHEGFCLWDSRWTDYKAPETPAGKDLLKPMVEAFRKEGLRTGLYHSLIDWHHPEYIIDAYTGPYRNSKIKERLNKNRRQSKYALYLRRQVKELLTGFGRIDLLFLDFSYPRPGGKGKKDWESEKLYKMIKELQPEILVNDRLDLEGKWDIKTPEQFQPREWVKVGGQPVRWETCQTFSGSWGYNRDETLWRDTGELIRTLVDCVSKGGNLLLNVGPTGRGEFDKRAMDRLKGIGEWMKRHGRAIYECTQAPESFETPQDCRLTYNGKTKRLYVHVLAWPYKHLHLDGKSYTDTVEYVQMLNDGSELKTDKYPVKGEKANAAGKEGLRITLPLCKPGVEVPVIEIYLK